MKSKKQRPETVSRRRIRQALDEAQQLLDAGHPDMAEKALHPLAMYSPSARDSEHAEVGGAGVGKLKRVKHLTQKRRRGKSPQQIRQHYALLVHRGKLKQAAAYFHAHAADIVVSLLAKPVEVHEQGDSLPHYKPDLADLATHHEQLVIAYKAEMLRRWKVKKEAKTLDGHKLVRFVAQNKSVFITPDPKRPVEPTTLRTAAAKLDGRTGIRKQDTAKSKAITAIQKEMAEERRKTKAKVKPAPVMRHPLPTFSISAADDASALNQ